MKLNEYSRGFVFNAIAFHAEPSEDLHLPMKPFVFFSSSKGVLLKVDPVLEVVVCSYHLHDGPIRSLFIQGGYAVTGGEDSKLKVWPMSFNEFLLEAQHEGPVSTLYVAAGGKKLVVGTQAGTLGVLDVGNHSYFTLLRSHCGSVTSVVAKQPHFDEFATVGVDGTIRVWDILTGLQKFEFCSKQDIPKIAVFHTQSVCIYI